MKVLLVNPALSWLAPEQPLGLLYVAAATRNAGHEVRVVDMTPMDITEDELLDIVDDFQPAVVGFSVMITSAGQACREPDG